MCRLDVAGGVALGSAATGGGGGGMGRRPVSGMTGLAPGAGARPPAFGGVARAAGAFVPSAFGAPTAPLSRPEPAARWPWARLDLAAAHLPLVAPDFAAARWATDWRAMAPPARPSDRTAHPGGPSWRRD